MKKYFLTGLVTLLPLAVTIWVIHFLVRFLTQPFMGLATSLISRFSRHFFGAVPSLQTIQTVSEIFILAGLFVFTFLLGFVARKYFFKQILRLGDRIVHKIPLVNKVYKTAKEIVRALFSSNENSFKQVVLLPFPYQGCYCLGLIARNAPQTCSAQTDDELVSVFVPTTPNPTTGFLVMCRQSELIHLEMKAQDAIKYIVSCAVIQPGAPS